eukprot:CAMPEP_0172012684 /NCGR_PEP_ID=MMETSP1041-20130122/8978_1 /TAXON_ID=464988 /ORGANISM="Hemiselmis andersenii, Strain CCMP439" /LENGTH=163 /DNA_ID=CAMNT_0012667295 /DNA_START=754 /DNA_END=1245 /DNA_ORIENTATION=-
MATSIQANHLNDLVKVHKACFPVLRLVERLPEGVVHDLVLVNQLTGREHRPPPTHSDSNPTSQKQQPYCGQPRQRRVQIPRSQGSFRHYSDQPVAHEADDEAITRKRVCNGEPCHRNIPQASFVRDMVGADVCRINGRNHVDTEAYGTRSDEYDMGRGDEAGK